MELHTYIKRERERGREIWCISTQSEMNGENAMLERLLNKEESRVMGGRKMSYESNCMYACIIIAHM